jgi:hypothetical protein
MRIEPIHNTSIGKRREHRYSERVEPMEASKSVVLHSSSREHAQERGSFNSSRVAMHAPLVAQLIATHNEVPQTRTYRRVSNVEGTGAYAAVRSVVTQLPQLHMAAIKA